MTFQTSLAAGCCWAMPTVKLVMFEFCEERKWFLAEGRFLSDCTKKTQLHFLEGKFQAEIQALAVGKMIG